MAQMAVVLNGPGRRSGVAGGQRHAAREAAAPAAARGASAGLVGAPCSAGQPAAVGDPPRPVVEPASKTIRQVEDLLDQAADLVATVDVLPKAPAQHDENAEFELVAAYAGLRAVAIGAFLACGAWQSPTTRAKIGKIRALAGTVPLRVSTRALARVLSRPNSVT